MLTVSASSSHRSEVVQKRSTRPATRTSTVPTARIRRSAVESGGPSGSSTDAAVGGVVRREFPTTRRAEPLPRAAAGRSAGVRRPTLRVRGVLHPWLAWYPGRRPGRDLPGVADPYVDCTNAGHYCAPTARSACGRVSAGSTAAAGRGASAPACSPRPPLGAGERIRGSCRGRAERDRPTHVPDPGRGRRGRSHPGGGGGQRTRGMLDVGRQLVDDRRGLVHVGKRVGRAGQGWLPLHRADRRDRRLLPGRQPLGHQRVHLRELPLRPADGHRRRRDGPAVPVPVVHPQRRLRHLDDDAPPEHQVPRRIGPDRRRGGQQLQRACGPPSSPARRSPR